MNEASVIRQHMLDIFNAALQAVDPYYAVLKAVKVEEGQLKLTNAKYPLAAFERIMVVGAGKATARMAVAIESLLGGTIATGLILVKDGHQADLAIIEQVEASHPIPNLAGITGTLRMLQMIAAADEKSLVICLISGGASALLVAPVAGLELQDKQLTTGLLLNAGASITELNAVRKHLSRIKGGRLAQAAYPAQLVTLILSDVINNPLAVIASGPTAPDNSTYNDAWSVITKYGLQQKLPQRVREYLQSGIAGLVPETIKEADVCLQNCNNLIVASLSEALVAAAEKSSQSGYKTKIISSSLEGEARHTAKFMAQQAQSVQLSMKSGERCCLLFGGETTVTVRGSGKGGRNQELALAFALEVEGMEGVSMLSAGTDGGDGPTDAAGAMVDGTTATEARDLGLEPLIYLDNNDSYGFFQQFDALSGRGSHFKIGPTGTNVMDIQIVLLNQPFVSKNN